MMTRAAIVVGSSGFAGDTSDRPTGEDRGMALSLVQPPNEIGHGVDCLAARHVVAEVDMGRRGDGVAGVAAVADDVAGGDLVAVLEDFREGAQMRVVPVVPTPGVKSGDLAAETLRVVVDDAGLDR